MTFVKKTKLHVGRQISNGDGSVG